MSVDIQIPPVLRIGDGSSDTIGELLISLGLGRPLIVTDGFLARSGVVDRLVELLLDAGVTPAVFSETVPDPTTESLGGGLEALRAHDADSVVAIGGGSPIDTAKALAVLAVRGGQMRELKAPVQYAGPALPVIAVPTTAGTGSEATRFTIITDSASGEKMLCAGHSYLPAAAVVDYRLTVSMPRRLTADTGIDALTHAIEAYVSVKANSVSDVFALDAISRIGRNLRRVWDDGTDVAAREEMMTAATLAGIAFSNSSVALVHGMSRPLGAHFGVAHGMANAMLFAEVTAFSVAAAEHRYARCAWALGVASEQDADADAASALVIELRTLGRELEVPTPAEFGVSREEWESHIPIMAEQALASGSPANNPRVPTSDEIARIYQTIYA